MYAAYSGISLAFEPIITRPSKLRGERSSGSGSTVKPAATSRSLATSKSSASTHACGSPLPHASSDGRSEEHTSELQSREKLVCRLLLEKKKKWMRQRHQSLR